MKIQNLSIFCLALFWAAFSAEAEIKVPAIFGDHMVLQQDQKLPVWGWADPGEEVTVEFAGQSKSVRADATGKWRVDLDPVPGNSAPAELKVKSLISNLKFTDVLVGEVWAASGQSNMEFQLSRCSTGGEDLPKAEHPQIRFFQIPRTDRIEPQENAEAKWVVCTPQSIRDFSAVAYYFGTEISRTLHDRPVGIIGTYWGGTPAQSWISLSGLQKDPAFPNYVNQAQNNLNTWLPLKADYPRLQAEYLEARKKWDEEIKPGFDAANKAWSEEANKAKAEGKPEPAKPQPKEPMPPAPKGPNPGPGNATVLFNGMIAPVIPYAIKGVIWYQGESNAGQAMEYRTLFPRLITDWREKWGQGDFPFFFVQLAGFGGGRGNENYPLLREAQLKTLALPNTGMAVAMDIGNEKDIHPKDKKDVGLRLAQSAKKIAYGQEVVPSGPIYDSMKVEGNKVRLSFKYVGGGLTVGVAPENPAGSSVSELQGFTIAGEGATWVPAQARIDGDSIIVSSDQVTEPVAVRYAWAGFTACNLYNKEGLPASPFRTDEWPATTEPQPSQIAPAVEWKKQCADRVAAIKGGPCDIIFIGDSITQNFQESAKAGWNLVGRPVWDKYYGNRNVLNFGVGGDSTQNALYRMDTMDIQTLRPKVAVVMLGMNNQNDTPEDIAAGVKAVIGKARAMFPGVKIIAMSVTANGRMPEKTPKINEILQTFANGKDIFYVDLYSKMPASGGGWKGVGGDKVHLTEEGYELWAAELEPLLKTLL